MKLLGWLLDWIHREGWKWEEGRLCIIRIIASIFCCNGIRDSKLFFWERFLLLLDRYIYANTFKYLYPITIMRSIRRINYRTAVDIKYLCIKTECKKNVITSCVYFETWIWYEACPVFHSHYFYRRLLVFPQKHSLNCMFAQLCICIWIVRSIAQSRFVRTQKRDELCNTFVVT